MDAWGSLSSSAPAKSNSSGKAICAQVGANLQESNAGFGDTAEQALLDLVGRLREGGETLWVPYWAQAYLEDGALKAQCPECGFVTTM